MLLRHTAQAAQALLGGLVLLARDRPACPHHPLDGETVSLVPMTRRFLATCTERIGVIFWGIELLGLLVLTRQVTEVIEIMLCCYKGDFWRVVKLESKFSSQEK